ncbi:MAG: Tetratricopeptide repeat [Pseudomonadota bacterium]|jgi:hypothetical protein
MSIPGLWQRAREAWRTEGAGRAEPILRQLVDLQRTSPDGLPSDLHEARLSLAHCLFEQQRPAESLELERLVLTESERREGPLAERTLEALHAMGASLLELGRLEEADTSARDMLARCEAIGDAAHPLTAPALRLGGLVAEARGDAARSEALHRRRYEREVQLAPREERRLRNFARHWGWSLVNLRRPEAARGAFALACPSPSEAPPAVALGLAFCTALETGDDAPVHVLLEDCRASGRLDAVVIDQAERRLQQLRTPTVEPGERPQR